MCYSICHVSHISRFYLTQCRLALSMLTQEWRAYVVRLCVVCSGLTVYSTDIKSLYEPIETD